jgi:transcriptional regulator with XRE-family HTH domain
LPPLGTTIADTGGNVKGNVTDYDWTALVDEILRRGRGLTDAQLAERMRMSESTIRRWRQMRDQDEEINDPRGDPRQALLRLAAGVVTLPSEGSANLPRQTRVRESQAGYAREDLMLPDVSFLSPAAQAYFDETIGNWMRRGWTFETVERAAELLLGYFNRTSTLLSSGTSVPDLSEEMQIHVLRESRGEIEHAAAALARGQRR